MAVYIYVVARDFGFAPNPFHGVCTLATCKPVVRRKAKIGDWVIGMGGAKLDAVGRCIFAMQVTATMSFDEYWTDPRFRDKRPVRNGSRVMMLGDNIYHQEDGDWRQLDSHHSRPDGSPDLHNVGTDTGTDRVLISEKFFYFGSSAPEVPKAILDEIQYTNLRGHRVYMDYECEALLNWFVTSQSANQNRIVDDPFQFKQSAARYSVSDDKIFN
ncbi:Nmad2 family putative nucleotide modification protein (plasmid) [Rhizobium leguminosarum]